MSISLRTKGLAGAIALAIGGGAMANTSISTGGTTAPAGNIFLNIVDTTQGTSFLFDTGLTSATFNGSASYTFNTIASDPNYSSFLSSEKSGDTIAYSVVGGYVNTTSTAATAYFTANAAPVAQAGNSISSAVSAIGTFAQNANLITSATTNSNYAIGGSANSGNWQSAEPQVTGQLAVYDGTTVGTALNFYEESSVNLRSGTILAALSQYAGQWDFSTAGVLTYGSGSTAVPLPAPVLLLLSGLGLMGVVSRRNKAAV
jgi:hypothetical protein